MWKRRGATVVPRMCDSSRLSAVMVVFLLCLHCPCGRGRQDPGVRRSPVASGPATASDIRRFLDGTNYTTASPHSPVLASAGAEGGNCRVSITFPVLGHGADPAAAPRLARSRARVEAEVAKDRGACGRDVGGAEAGVELVVLVDGAEEAVSREGMIDARIEGLETGIHTLVVRAVSASSGEVLAHAGPLVFVILPDVEVLFPAEGHAFSPDDTVMLAFAVSPTAIANHVCDGGNGGGECRVPTEERAVGLGIFINGQSAAVIEMSPEDGDDGRRTYHVSLGQMQLGSYHIAVTMTAEGGKDAVGEASATQFVVVACARNGRECEGAGGERGVAGMYEGCRAPSSPLCHQGGCSGHGECRDHVCVCEGDWIGEVCGHSLLGDATYMPSIDPVLWEGRCQQAVSWSNASREVIHRLELLHQGESWSPVNFMLFPSRMHGLGAQVHYLTECLTTAWLSNKGALIAPPASDGGVDCNAQQSGHMLLHELFHCGHLTPFAKCKAESLGSSNAQVVEPEAGNSRYGGGGRTDGSKGTFWWRAHLAWFVMQPSVSLSASIRQAKASMGWATGRGGVLGVQVRHGDSCIHAKISNFRPECAPFGAYRERIVDMVRRYGVTKVFVATDDPEVVGEARAMETEIDGVNVMSLDVDRRMLTGDWFLEFRTQERGGSVRAGDVTASALLDLMLLSECDYFVGSFASHMSRLAYELIVARLGYFPPYSSVDYPWCFSFLEKGEVPGFGMVNC